MNYVERHFGDWARDTSHLSMLEDGAYNRLCDCYYVREQPLPSEITACCRLVRAITTTDKAAVKSVLHEFFELTQEGWRHKRCDVEIERFRTKSGKASASANARWSAHAAHTERNANAPPNAMRTHMPSHSERNANGMPHAGADGRAPTPHSPLPTSQAPDPTHPTGAPVIGAAKSPRPSRKAPPEFAVTPELQQWAKANTPSVDARRETDKFRDHTFKTALTDWDGAWRNWLRRAAETARGKPVQSTADRDAEAMSLLGFGDPHHA